MERKRRATFIMSLDLPEGMSVDDAQTYIHAAIRSWCKNQDLGTPAFYLDANSPIVIRHEGASPDAKYG